MCLLAICLPLWAQADPVQIPGPEGPLEAEEIAVPGASHALVIIPGSGPTDRDGNAAQAGVASDAYKLLAEGLAQEGVASLRIDKRGLFGSESAIADPNAVTIAAYADDANAWVEKAASLASCVWLAGHSEGGLVALAAAQTAPDTLCGLILLATPGRPLEELLVQQLAANPANAPLMEDLKAIVADLKAGQTRDTQSIPPALQPLFPLSIQPYLIDLFSYDPVQLARTWQGPVLIVQGDADVQVTPDDAQNLQTAMPHADILSLVGGTHMLKAAIPERPFATYTDPSLPLHPGLLSGIMNFLNAARRPD